MSGHTYQYFSTLGIHFVVSKSRVSTSCMSDLEVSMVLMSADLGVVSH